MGITLEELRRLEKELKVSGYVRWTNCLSANETYGWFKSFKDSNGHTMYIIEFRIWDHQGSQFSTHPFGMDTLVISHDRIDLSITSPQFDIPTTEEIAKRLWKMLDPFVKGK